MTDAANRVRERREALSLSQGALADRVGVSRQSVGTIEAGRATPGVDVALRLAAALGCSVEQLFVVPSAPTTLVTDSTDVERGERATVARLGGRWVSFALGSTNTHVAADGIIASVSRGVTRVELLRPPAELEHNLVMVGCALGLGLLADRLNSRPGAGRFHWFSRSSSAALDALGKQRTHVAGVHLTDSRTGEANVTDVKRLQYAEPISLVTLARWEVGLLLRPGTNLVRSIADLARPGVRLVGREPGAGTQRLLERRLRAQRLPLDLARRPHCRASCHLGVARAIALGAADVGLATRDAAMALDLDFVALAEERFDLAIPNSTLSDARVERLLDALASLEFRRELTALGYDTRQTGQRVGEVRAA